MKRTTQKIISIVIFVALINTIRIYFVTYTKPDYRNITYWTILRMKPEDTLLFSSPSVERVFRYYQSKDTNPISLTEQNSGTLEEESLNKLTNKTWLIESSESGLSRDIRMKQNEDTIKIIESYAIPPLRVRSFKYAHNQIYKSDLNN